jgi:hypothetical protein
MEVEAALAARVLDVAECAARAAGRLIRKHCGATAVAATKSGPQDLVTAVDAECQVRRCGGVAMD